MTTLGPTSSQLNSASPDDDPDSAVGYRTHRPRSSPLSSADAAFRLLTRGPSPLAIQGGEIAGLPEGLIPLDELKRLLLRPGTGGETRDAAWAALVTRARDHGAAWTIGTVGVAMPGLRRAAGKLSRGYHGDTADIDAEVLTGFLTAMKTVDLESRAIALRLRWAAYRAGAAFRAAEANWASQCSDDPDDQVGQPQRHGGHPDLVLASAVQQGIISAQDAALIGSTRLEPTSLVVVAAALSVPYDTARMRRSRAETRLTSAIHAGDLNGTRHG